MRKVIALLTVIVVLGTFGISGCSFGIARAPTATPTPTRTPKPTFTSLVIETPTPEVTPTATNTQVLVPADTPVLAPTDTPAPVPTDTPAPVPTDTPAPPPTATPMATNTPISPPTATSPPPPPTATPTHTPAPVVPRCSYVAGSRETSAAGKPAEGTQPSTIIEGSVIDAAGNPLNNYGVEFEHPSVGIHCVVAGDPSKYWPAGQWKHEFWAALGTDTTYYLTIKESCASGAPALSERVDFPYKWWPSGHHFNITFRCNF